jgi:hypothetical protein
VTRCEYTTDGEERRVDEGESFGRGRSQSARFEAAAAQKTHKGEAAFLLSYARPNLYAADGPTNEEHVPACRQTHSGDLPHKRLDKPVNPFAVR